MLFDSSVTRRACAWLLIGLIAAAAGCSSEPDKGAGSSGSGVASSGKLPNGGEIPSAPTGPSSLTFGSDNKLPDIGEPTAAPPFAPPPGEAARTSPPAEGQPITAPPDLPPPESAKSEPASSGSAKPTAASPARQSGEPIFLPPEKPSK